MRVSVTESISRFLFVIELRQRTDSTSVKLTLAKTLKEKKTRRMNTKTKQRINAEEEQITTVRRGGRRSGSG
jgi:hypothetical protein